MKFNRETKKLNAIQQFNALNRCQSHARTITCINIFRKECPKTKQKITSFWVNASDHYPIQSDGRWNNFNNNNLISPASWSDCKFQCEFISHPNSEWTKPCNYFTDNCNATRIHLIDLLIWWIENNNRLGLAVYRILSLFAIKQLKIFSFKIVETIFRAFTVCSFTHSKLLAIWFGLCSDIDCALNKR